MEDPLSRMPGYLLRRASAACFAEISALLAPLGVRPTEASILTLIANNPAVTQSDIGAQLGIQRANMTPLVARLEEHGWVNRERRDGRSQALALTDLGETLQKHVWAEVERYENGLIEAIPENHREHFQAVLTALWHHHK